MKLKALDLQVYLGNNHILKGVSIEVRKKEFVGIIGPNGSGKSTLLKCIYRSLKPSKGTILIDDKDINSFSIKETARTFAVMSQFNNYNFDFTVLDMVLMGRAPHKGFIERDNALDYRIVRESLEKVEMQDYSKRNFSSLSGGEKQRIILARALAQKTPGLILDEPTNHLDIKYQLQLMSIVKGLNKTVVAAIHDLNIAAMYCDKIYAMKSGKIFKYGTPKEVLTKDIIKELYDVEADVTEDRKIGLLNIKYKPTYVL
ncbi:ABC transporter ATP-binding protein [Clostridium botulinum]|uniref:ABC transporter ATP-binding protein n=1 Tax=Clostridium botulinum TaxID=1491 RepID=UPI00052E137D|nr:ABC transporter ATP-binding protein [Clostridium botulinum]KGM96197.1 ABC transporter [Clostridium botulinum D str. CCUG 7971]KOC46007.1 ABC transporter [Clostridium botulinum]NFO97949.1 ABC transporter ATP-binding protein [Clostridium botulinum]OOV51700.1 ABC transporter [Clostridium botulinum D/C]OOV55922.1 ABC transporter [Clostridium botulinum D/C]